MGALCMLHVACMSIYEHTPPPTRTQFAAATKMNPPRSQALGFLPPSAAAEDAAAASSAGRLGLGAKKDLRDACGR